MAAVLLVASIATAVLARPPVDLTPELEAAKVATAKYNSVTKALADGYAPGGSCVSAPPGGMGFHYGNSSLVGDFAVDPLQPETLLYVPRGNTLRLVGVEYHMDALANTIDGPALWWEEEEPPLGWFTTPPELFGETFNGPMEGHGPNPWHYDLHVWLWAENPSGMFATFNPNVSC